MSIDRHRIEVGLCPSPGRQVATEWSTPVAMEQSYDEEENRLTVTMYLLRTGRIKPDRVLTVRLCPLGHSCGCSYEAEVGWTIQGDCSANLYWTWPAEAG